MALRVSETWIEGVSEIITEVVNHFTKIFREPDSDRPCLDGVIFIYLSEDDNFTLSAPFSLLELDVVVSL